jgi:predicted Fe-Mo cluster-binding NifX family protein
MKIAITAQGSELNSQIDPRFGRCKYFLIFDENGNLLKIIKNESIKVMRGAGVTAAQIISDENVDLVITGNMGPNADMVMKSANIKVISGIFDKTIKDVLEMYKNENLRK